MRILIVGHEGYLGSGLAELLGHRHAIVGLGRVPGLSSLTTARLVADRIDGVVNCAAAFSRMSQSVDPAGPSLATNVDSVRTLVRALRGTDIPLIQLSTKDVYGPAYLEADVIEEPRRFVPRFRVDEATALAPLTEYGITKLLGEAVALVHEPATVVRLSTCYTDHAHPQAGWVFQLVKRATRGEEITLNGTGKQFRDALHVADLAALIETIFANPNDAPPVLCAGGGPANTYSLLEVLDVIDRSVPVRTTGLGGDFGFAFDTALAERFGWRPRVLLRDAMPGLRRAAQRGA